MFFKALMNISLEDQFELKLRTEHLDIDKYEGMFNYEVEGNVFKLSVNHKKEKKKFLNISFSIAETTSWKEVQEYILFAKKNLICHALKLEYI